MPDSLLPIVVAQECAHYLYRMRQGTYRLSEPSVTNKALKDKHADRCEGEILMEEIFFGAAIHRKLFWHADIDMQILATEVG